MSNLPMELFRKVKLGIEIIGLYFYQVRKFINSFLLN
jgi:hypothetical protein